MKRILSRTSSPAFSGEYLSKDSQRLLAHYLFALAAAIAISCLKGRLKAKIPFGHKK